METTSRVSYWGKDSITCDLSISIGIASLYYKVVKNLVIFDIESRAYQPHRTRMRDNQGSHMEKTYACDFTRYLIKSCL